jgi:hypothetical protein
VRPRPSTTTIPTPGALATLNMVPGEEDAEAELAAEEEGGDAEEGEDELDEPRADEAAVLLLEELPQAASKMRAALADAAMGNFSRRRRSRPGTRVVIVTPPGLRRFTRWWYVASGPRGFNGARQAPVRSA